MSLNSWLAARVRLSELGGCAANASDHREALDDALCTAFATVTGPTLVEVTVN